MGKTASFDSTDELELAVPTPSPADISQALILDMAAGWEEPEVIARRYGFEGMAWARLQEYKPFLVAVDVQRAELERDGTMFRSKARALAGDVFTDLYKWVKSPESTYNQKQNFVELAAKFADMMPKATVAPVAAAGSVTIMFTTAGVPAPMTFDATPSVVDVAENTPLKIAKSAKIAK